MSNCKTTRFLATRGRIIYSFSAQATPRDEAIGVCGTAFPPKKQQESEDEHRARKNYMKLHTNSGNHLWVEISIERELRGPAATGHAHAKIIVRSRAGRGNTSESRNPDGPKTWRGSPGREAAEPRISVPKDPPERQRTKGFG